MPMKILSKMISTEDETSTEYDLEVTIMALSNLFGWNKKAETTAPATACGAGDKPAEKPAACGSACGAGDKPLRSLPLAALPAALATSSKGRVPTKSQDFVGG